MKKLFFPVVLFILFLVLAIPTFASNGDSIKTLPRGETITGDYFAAGDQVNINGTVQGDAYVAGGNVTIDGTIDGDLLVAGGNVIINGTIGQDIRAFGGDITVSADQVGGSITTAGGNVRIVSPTSITKNLVAASGNLDISAPITGNANLAGGNIRISSNVDGNVQAATEQLSLTEGATIGGNLTYWSQNKVNIDEGASVSGNIEQKEATFQGRSEVTKGLQDAGKAFGVGFKIFSLIVSLAFALIFFYLLPELSKSVTSLIGKRPGMSALIGFLTLILTPIIGIILLITIVGIPFSLIIMFAYFIILFFGKIFFSVFLGQKVMYYITKNDRQNTFWVVLVGIVVYSIITLIPVIGTIVSFIAVIIGTGALLIAKKNFYLAFRKKNLI